MSSNLKTCLYIHGLHSSVRPEKRKVLEKLFANVLAFDIDYGQQTNVYNTLMKVCHEQHVDLIIGSSFGGYLGFYLAAELGIPSILFNPALMFGKEDKTYVTQSNRQPVPFSLFVVGAMDTVVPPESIDNFIIKHPEESGIHVMKCSWLKHQIDLKTFEAAIVGGLSLYAGQSSI